jgi:hypothetical protein
MTSILPTTQPKRIRHSPHDALERTGPDTIPDTVARARIEHLPRRSVKLGLLEHIRPRLALALDDEILTTLLKNQVATAPLFFTGDDYPLVPLDLPATCDIVRSARHVDTLLCVTLHTLHLEIFFRTTFAAL